MVTLLMLSGGIDSTYALYKLLKETDDEVLVHHINLLTSLGRHIPESTSCMRIVEYCRKNVRDFHYSQSAIDHRGFVSHGYDLIAAGFEAGVIASSYYSIMQRKKSIDRWIIGLAKDDSIAPDRLGRAQVCCEANCQNAPAPQISPLYPLRPVREQVEYLPRELYALTWSCRHPQGLPDNAKPCDRCDSCRRRAPFDQATQHVAA